MTQEDFDRLLGWLDTDRELAARKYEEIHASLVKIFSWRGYHDAEELADEVINRVAPKVKELAVDYIGDPSLYFYGVARKILLECERRRPHQLLSPEMKVADGSACADEPDVSVRQRKCLRKCLRKLDSEDKELILSYYKKSRQAKIDYRKALAEELGIGTNALRVRVHRIRSTLKSCVKKCLNTDPAVK